MGIDTETGYVFFRHGSRVIRHLERHQDIPMDFWYVDVRSGDEFDVRDFTPEMLGDISRDAVLSGDRDVHKAAICHVLDKGFPLKRSITA